MNKNKNKIKRQSRVRSKVRGTKERPRLSVFRSNKAIYVQLINDEEGKTILGMTESHLEEKNQPARSAGGPAGRQGGQKSIQAKNLGMVLAKKALEKKIKKVVFDRGGYIYHGRIKSLAQGAREGGLEF
ncbi:MAG: 50S ribosomal protein L18 [Candidatus Levyibacteriota bacterium]